MLAAYRVRNMTGLGIRVLLTAHALWRGRPPLLLQTATVPTTLGIERVRFAHGRMEVVAAGLLVETQAYIRPGGAGHRAEKVQRAAEYDLPHARKGAQVQLEAGDERLPGYWRIMSDDLLQIVGVTREKDGIFRQFLTDDQLRVLILLAQGRRTEGGALSDPAEQRTTAQALASQSTELTLRTVQRALVAIEERGLARKVAGGVGRAPAIYEPHGLLTSGLPWKRKL